MSDSQANDRRFWRLLPIRLLEENTHGVAIADAFSVPPGYTLAVPKRHSARPLLGC